MVGGRAHRTGEGGFLAVAVSERMREDLMEERAETQSRQDQGQGGYAQEES
jgi:hypothetical protein